MRYRNDHLCTFILSSCLYPPSLSPLTLFSLLYITNVLVLLNRESMSIGFHCRVMLNCVLLCACDMCMCVCVCVCARREHSMCCAGRHKHTHNFIRSLLLLAHPVYFMHTYPCGRYVFVSEVCACVVHVCVCVCVCVCECVESGFSYSVCGSRVHAHKHLDFNPVCHYSCKYRDCRVCCGCGRSDM